MRVWFSLLRSPAHMPGRVADRILGAADDHLDRLRGRGWGDAPAACLLIAPALSLIAVFSLFPMAASLYMSLFGGRHGAGTFVGLRNYAEALGNPDFRQSLQVTVYYVLGVVPLTLGVSFITAYALYRIAWGRGLFCALYFLPYVTSAVAAAMVWRALFNPQHGVANRLLALIGAEPLNWLLEPRGVLHLLSGGWIPAAWGPSLALSCIILFDVWHGCGFMIVVFLAGMAGIPREIEESARIDGAGGCRVVAHVVFPLLSPTFFFLLIVSVIKAFQAFNSFYALTQGAGSADTQNLVLYIYAQFYQYGYWGYGAATASMLMAAIVLLTIVQWRFVGRRVYYS